MPASSEQHSLGLSGTRAPFRLRSLEVFNWGPFSGLHQAEIDPDGTAIIGMTGSGKTTLIDAFVTLLAETPKYNLASTGGHESDRSLISYVRGVIGSGNNSGEGEHISRKTSTTTGLCATYTDGRETLRCAGILWLEGVSTAYADLKRVWIFSRDPAQSLENWLSLHHDGGLRALKQHLRDQPAIQLYDTANGGKRAYLARLRAFFEVGENAFNLLNRAAGLKQLNSIDDIFRELVLDDRSVFADAVKAADDFTTLADIHAELVLARDQQRSLLPVEQLHHDHLSCIADLELRRRLKRILPVSYALHARRLWQTRVSELRTDLAKAKTRLDAAEAEAAEARLHSENRHARYLQSGGADIDSLRALIGKTGDELARRRRAASDFSAICAGFSLPPPASEAAFASTLEKASALRTPLETEKKQAEDAAFQIGVTVSTHQTELTRLQTEKREIEASPGSNLPGDFQRFRAALAAHLGLAPADLPFVAELVQVKDAESGWRGAIERALGGHRLRILVPHEHTRDALRWINARHNQLHVRLLEADTTAPAGAAAFLSDGFTRKLDLKPHPLREPLKALLASLDLHCVDSTDVLHRTPHALTIEGATSGKSGYFDKQDQRRLDEGWCTGFDNRDRLAEITRRLAAAEKLVRDTGASLAPARAQVAALEKRLQRLAALARTVFADIDVAGSEAELAHHQRKLSDLLAPDSDTARALRDYEDAKASADKLNKAHTAAVSAHTTAANKHEAAEKSAAACAERIGDGLAPDDATLAAEHLPLADSVAAETIDRAERAAAAELDRLLTTLNNRQTKLENDLVRAMEHAKRLDNGPLAESGTELIDLPAYLQRLHLLTQEALPAKLDRFLNYLNNSSDQGVSALLRTVTEEVARIGERIEDLNRSLHDVDFKEGCYLHLDLQPIVHDSLRALEHAQRQLRVAALRTDDQGEGHYLALKNLVQILRDAAEKKHTVGARALLDPRFRVEFQGVEIDRATGREIARFKGSQGGSGGEKEIIASYILTASLSYALSPDGARRPLHATIVLDEAFSKSSRAVARRIVNALGEFGLHPIFVTPNKELRLLRAHTRSVVFVHRKESRATLASIRWTELDERARAAGATVPASEPVNASEASA